MINGFSFFFSVACRQLRRHVEVLGKALQDFLVESRATNLCLPQVIVLHVNKFCSNAPSCTLGGGEIINFRKNENVLF